MSDPLNAPSDRLTHGVSAVALTAAGFVAAWRGIVLRAALLLATVGLGSAWLGGLAPVAAPHRVFLLAAATICLVAAAILLWRQRSVAACARGTFSSRPAVRGVTLIGLLVGLVLLYLGYAYV